MPTAIRCFAVLDGGNAGKILTDNPDCPRWGVVAMLRQDGLVAVGFRENDPSVDFLPPDPDAGAACLEFDRPIGCSNLSPYLGRLPEGYQIYRMDRKLVERSPKRDEIVIRYGSIDNFLDKGAAVCVMHGEETVCEAYADMNVMGVRELGVTTQKAYRGQGFATIVCAHLIQICEETGCQTYWDCAKLNLASAALARKLGFRNEREYKQLAWFQSKG